MKFKMYQVPVTEMYAVRTQVVMDATVNPSNTAEIVGGGEDDGEGCFD